MQSAKRLNYKQMRDELSKEEEEQKVSYVTSNFKLTVSAKSSKSASSVESGEESSSESETRQTVDRSLGKYTTLIVFSAAKFKSELKKKALESKTHHQRMVHWI